MSTPPWAKKWWIFAWSNPEYKAAFLEGKMVVDGKGVWCSIHGRLYFLAVRHLPGIYK